MPGALLETTRQGFVLRPKLQLRNRAKSLNFYVDGMKTQTWEISIIRFVAHKYSQTYFKKERKKQRLFQWAGQPRGGSE